MTSSTRQIHLSDDLFQPVQLGRYRLANRIVMAPLTRSRASADGPVPLMVEYYRQRASAGLIISEGANLASPAPLRSRLGGRSHLGFQIP
jgi:N-ethylmaleimide reductase